MGGFLLDTSAVSALVDRLHKRHDDVYAAVADLPYGSEKFVSAITLAELKYGRDREFLSGRPNPDLDDIIRAAEAYPFLDIRTSTSRVYADLRARLAIAARTNSKGKPPRQIEEWIMVDDSQKLQFGENDLWQGAIAIDRDLTLIAADGDFDRMRSRFPHLKVFSLR